MQPENNPIRSRKQTAKRAAALAAAGMYAESFLYHDKNTEPASALLEQLLEDGYVKEAFFTDAELSFLSDEAPDETDAFQLQWGYEGYAALLWAMGFLTSLPLPQVPHDAAKTLRFLLDGEDFAAFYRHGRLRSEEELREALAKRTDPAGKTDPELCWEQWRALYWLCHPEADWDTIE